MTKAIPLELDVKVDGVNYNAKVTGSHIRSMEAQQILKSLTGRTWWEDKKKTFSSHIKTIGQPNVNNIAFYIGLDAG